MTRSSAPRRRSTMFRLPPHLLIAAKAIATQCGVSLTAVVELGLAEFIRTPFDPDALRDRMEATGVASRSNGGES